MIRILHITSSLAKNGTETFIMNVYRQIDRSLIQFDFLIFTESTDGFCDEVLSLGGQIYRLPPRRQGFFRYRNELNAFFREKGNLYQGIHLSSCTLSSVLPVQIASKYGIPLRIVHAHNSSWSGGAHNYIFHMINKHRLRKYVTHCLACSEVAAKWFYSGTSLLEKSIVVKNGIDVEKFNYNPDKREQIRKDIHAEHAFVVGHIGRFTKVKNQSFLLDVFREIKKKRPNAILLLVGEGELELQVKKKAEVMGLEESVKFMGRRDDVSDLLQGMDCFVFPSLFEGLPFALIEAQAAGLPVITSENVSPEVSLTSGLHFLSLKQSPAIWADEIVRFASGQRIVDIKGITTAGYSIQMTVDVLVKIYTQK